MSVKSDNQRIWKSILTGILTAFVLTLLLTCLFGFILKMTSGIPYGIIDYVMIGIEGISVLLGAYIAGVIAKGKGLVIGAVCGGAALLILLACGLSMAQNDIGFLTLIRSAVMLLCGIIGGIAGVNRKEKVRIK
ncbi:MAG: TIGR04086 family membrane protein [Ruminococcus sp.]|nr:TIGR04086 family membrane protein [Ruminococcus sp.]